MHRSKVIPNTTAASGGEQDGSAFRIVVMSGDGSSSEAMLELTSLAEAIRAGVREALANEDTLIGYPELARRMGLKEKFVRQLKNAGIIHAALDLGKVVRFHWPSVLAELRVATTGHRGLR